MEINVKETVKVESFEPITLEIKIDSKDELLDLYNKCRLDPRHVNQVFDEYGFSKVVHCEDEDNHTYDLFDTLDRIIRNRNYIK